MSIDCGCTANTCSKYYYSACVKYTGTLITNSYYTLPACSVSINSIFNQTDTFIKVLMDNDGLLKSIVNTNNCNFLAITTLINDTQGLKLKTSETIIALLQSMCSLKERIVSLETTNIYDSLLPTEIQQFLILHNCLDEIDPCNLETLTLKQLLIKLIIKACP